MFLTSRIIPPSEGGGLRSAAPGPVSGHPSAAPEQPRGRSRFRPALRDFCATSRRISDCCHTWFSSQCGPGRPASGFVVPPAPGAILTPGSPCALSSVPPLVPPAGTAGAAEGEGEALAGPTALTKVSAEAPAGAGAARTPPPHAAAARPSQTLRALPQHGTARVSLPPAGQRSRRSA